MSKKSSCGRSVSNKKARRCIECAPYAKEIGQKLPSKKQLRKIAKDIKQNVDMSNWESI